MRYITLDEILELHQSILEQSGGGSGIRDFGLLQSALVQPRMTFAGSDLYRTLEEKAAALGFSLIANHPFVDGNKRVGHAAMETFLVLNGREIVTSVEDAERMILGVASGDADREDLLKWLQSNIVIK
ncbi:MAG: type II toxin-antitoxin system death-on-curing family toxin [Pirellulaceae bacterium]|nr:type II toxin-antitoxin system death-on-curing family toxin [Pirellulaceae bacterium]